MSVDFKNEDEVAEYIKNIGIEYRFGCYKEKMAESCHLLGDYFEAIKKDSVRAARVYQTTCDDYKLAKSCEKFAKMAHLGLGCQADPAQAEEYFLRGCDYGIASSCLQAGLMRIGRSDAAGDVTDDVRRDGVRLIERSCAGDSADDSADGCFHLSSLHLQSYRGLQRPCLNEAFRLSARACELGHVQACANVSRMYRRGDGVLASQQLSDQYKQRALELRRQLSERQISFQRGAAS